MIFTLLNEYNHLDNLTRLKMVICGQLEVDMEFLSLSSSNPLDPARFAVFLNRARPLAALIGVERVGAHIFDFRL